MEGVVNLLHMDTGERAPGPADGIEIAALGLGQPVQLLEMLVDGLARFVAVVVGQIHQPQRADRQGHMPAGLAPRETDQLQAAAAEIAHHARAVGHARGHAQRREPRLLLARDDANLTPAAALRLLHEGGTIDRIAHGRRRDHVEAADLHAIGEADEPLEIADRHGDAVLVELARRLEAAAQPAQDLFVEQRPGRATEAVEDHQTDGV